MSLAFEGEFRKMVDLGKEIQREIGLPEPNIITLIHDCLFKP
jgi:hypothetical protein